MIRRDRSMISMNFEAACATRDPQSDNGAEITPITMEGLPSSPAEDVDLPFVSVIVAVRNEKEFIAGCIESVLHNGYPLERLELLLVDGESSDGTREILARYRAEYSAVEILDNLRRTAPAALNLAIRRARGEIIVRVDAHARLAPDYLRGAVEWLARSGADNVGGGMRTLPRGPGLCAAAIALALSHPFGVGDSSFRTAVGRSGGEPRWVDTVFGGCYRRAVFERIGLFNERLARGQDLEFNLRLRQAGGRTLLAPQLRCDYFARSDVRSFLRHNWTNGVWAVRPFFESEIVPVRPRHLAPLAFALAVLTAAAAGLSGLGAGPLAALWLAYGAAGFAAALDTVARGELACGEDSSCQLGSRRHELPAGASLSVRPRARVRLAFLVLGSFFGLHVFYGLGSAWGLVSGSAIWLVRRGRLWGKRRRPGSIRRAEPFCLISKAPIHLLLKRSLDLTLALAALLLLAPVLGAIAWAIRCDSPGPVLYRSRRSGRHGRPFEIYKFRTMVIDADRRGGPTTAADDPRLTAAGRWLRRYKLDELPQLLNVVAGEMSLVGPRPEVVEKTARYSPEERQILELPPGITDWASIWNSDEGAALEGCGDADAAYERLIRPTKIRLQLLYCERASLRVDAKILACTLLQLCRRDWLPAELSEFGKLGRRAWARAQTG